MASTGERFERLVSIMARLRGPGGCPWDREQTFDTIKPYTVEETYEVLEAIDQRNWRELPAELGDLLLQILFYSQMAQEEGTFSIDDVLERLASKLIGRHPHVFGDVKADTPAEVLRNWEMLKAEEKKRQAATETTSGSAPLTGSILDSVSKAMPSVIEAQKISTKAARVGFDWPDVESVLDKLQEETSELRHEIDQFPAPGPRPAGGGVADSGRAQIPTPLAARIEDEIGDLFFVLVNIARYLSVDPESALKKTNRKFRRRFESMELELSKAGKTVEQASMDELETLWQAAKHQERAD
jgi:MazG family protein